MNGVGFYAYRGSMPLDRSPVGTGEQSVYRDIKTAAGASRRAARRWPDGYSVYSFTNFYDDQTFRLVAQLMDGNK